jgi:hypothetical protein
MKCLKVSFYNNQIKLVILNVCLITAYGLLEKKTKFCLNRECFFDSKRLLEASNFEKVKPCDDFREYAMGNFIKYRALHDRYDRVGFLYDVLSSQSDRFRKILNEPIKLNETKSSKIVKHFFQQCQNPGD